MAHQQGGKGLFSLSGFTLRKHLGSLASMMRVSLYFLEWFSSSVEDSGFIFCMEEHAGLPGILWLSPDPKLLRHIPPPPPTGKAMSLSSRMKSPLHPFFFKTKQNKKPSSPEVRATRWKLISLGHPFFSASLGCCHGSGVDRHVLLGAPLPPASLSGFHFLPSE